MYEQDKGYAYHSELKNPNSSKASYFEREFIVTSSPGL